MRTSSKAASSRRYSYRGNPLVPRYQSPLPSLLGFRVFGSKIDISTSCTDTGAMVILDELGIRLHDQSVGKGTRVPRLRYRQCILCGMYRELSAI